MANGLRRFYVGVKQAAGAVGLTIQRSTSSETADLQRWSSETGGVMASVTNAGAFYSGAGVKFADGTTQITAGGASFPFGTYTLGYAQLAAANTQLNVPLTLSTAAGSSSGSVPAANAASSITLPAGRWRITVNALVSPSPSTGNQTLAISLGGTQVANDRQSPVAGSGQFVQHLSYTAVLTAPTALAVLFAATTLGSGNPAVFATSPLSYLQIEQTG